MQTNLKLAEETVMLMKHIEDNYSLFDGMAIDKSKLISESLATIQKNIAHLNSVYNGAMVEMKSVVQIAEERHRMTQEEFTTICDNFFDNILYDEVEYDGQILEVTGVDKADGLVFLPNGIGWQNFDSCKLIR